MTNKLNGKQYKLSQDTSLGELESVIPDIDNWTMTTSAPFKKSIEGGIAKGTISKNINLWVKHLQETKTGFYVEDHGIGFVANDKGKYRYWQARKRVNGKLYTLHAGVSKNLDHAKIESVCKKLLEKIEAKQ